MTLTNESLLLKDGCAPKKYHTLVNASALRRARCLLQRVGRVDSLESLLDLEESGRLLLSQGPSSREVHELAVPDA